MEKYIHKFNSIEEFEEAYDSDDYIEPWLSCIEGEPNSVRYNINIPEFNPSDPPVAPPIFK